MSSISRPASRSTTRKSGRGGSAAGKARRGRGKGSRQDQRKVVLVGIHFGDGRTRVAASENGDRLRLDRDVFTNIVGVLRIRGAMAKLATKASVLYAEQATELLEQIELRKPIVSGLVSDVRVCRQFLTHVCSAVDPSSTRRLWGVASLPAVAGPEELEKAYRSLKGPLERVVVVPEPYLAAEGMRLEKAVQSERFGQDLTRGSLIIDVGAGTSNVCLVRGGFPPPEDQLRLELAGNAIDDKIFTSALVHTPTLFVSRRMAREIKEEQAFVGDALPGVRGVSDLLTFTDVLRRACDALLEAVLEASCTLLDRCEPALAATVSRYIVLTGGGSRIRNLPAALEQGLRARGYQDARVLVPDDYQTLVARGALRFAQKLGEEEWLALASRTPIEIARLFSGAADIAAPRTGGGELEALARLDVGMRSEASPAPGSSEAPAASGPASTRASPAPGAAPVVHKERPELPEAIDIEELELFRAR